ncbi:MAG: hypothetical protein RML35_07830 [Chloroherpetonaceae bacterium]|nr:hypothetical protein [Chloroherpetonaceae bacterium]
MLGIVFFVSLSLALLVQSRQQSHKMSVQSPLVCQTWMQSVPMPNLPAKVALIFCDDASGCNACLQAEASDWQKWLTSDSACHSDYVQLICSTQRPERLRRELEALGITYPNSL